MNLNLPKVYNFGGNELVELSHLEKIFDISRRVAFKYLHALRIKPLYFGKEVFFSLTTFNRIMFVLSRPGSPGFLFPASKARANAALQKKGFLVQVTNDILDEAASPQVLAEMAAASGRDSSMIKKLLTHPPQKGLK